MRTKIAAFCLLSMSPAVTAMPLHAESSTRWEARTEPVCEVAIPPGSGPPFWGYHQPILVRSGERLYAGILEAWGTEAPQKQWSLFERSERGWRRVYTSPKERRLNQPPVLLVDRAEQLHAFVWEDGVCNHLRFDPGGETPTRDLPDIGFSGLWPYAGGAVNAEGDLLVIVSPYHAHLYGFRRASAGEWFRGTAVNHDPRPGTRLKYDTHCYPFVSLSGREAHIFSTQDVADSEKIEQKASFVYVFRTLEYYYSPDLLNTPYQTVHVANVEKSKGWAHNDDLLLDRSGRIHLLYRFAEGNASPSPLMHAFGPPGGPLTHRALVPADGGPLGESRLYETPDGALYIVGPQGPHLVAARLAEDGALAERPAPLGISPSSGDYTVSRIFLVPACAIASGAPFLEGLYQEQAEGGKTVIRYFLATPLRPETPDASD